MRIFITGASGYIGSAVALALRHAGHSVSGLVRTKEKAKLLEQREIVPVIGDVSKPKTYSAALQDVETVVHCAFDAAGGIVTENILVDTVLAKMKSSLTTPRSFIYTSGVWIIGNTGDSTADESTPCRPIELVKWRLPIEEKLMKASSPHFRVAILRPGCVYGGSGRLTSMWFDGAAQGAIEMVGDGHNRWSMVHIDDLAQAYVLAIEKELQGTILNIVDDTRYTVKEMASAAAAAAGIPGAVHALTPAEAQKKYGPTTQGLLIDQQVSNDRAERLLGWRPRHKSFINEAPLYLKAKG